MSEAVRRASQRAGSQWITYLQARRKPARMEQQRKRIPKNLEVEIPESKEYYDTANLKIGAGMVAVAILAKLTMMYDATLEEERTERKARELAESQDAPRIVSQEVWDELQQLRPRTPFESRIARKDARLRSGDALRLEDVKDWAVDVLTDALTRTEDSVER